MASLNNQTHSDWILVEDFRNGGERFSNNLSHPVAERVLKCCKKIGNMLGHSDPETAREISQEVQIELLGGRYRGESSLETYIWQGIGQKFFRKFKKEKRRKEAETAFAQDEKSNEFKTRVEAKISNNQAISKIIGESSELQKQVVRIILESDQERVNKREIARLMKLQDDNITRYQSDQIVDRLIQNVRRVLRL